VEQRNTEEGKVAADFADERVIDKEAKEFLGFHLTEATSRNYWSHLSKIWTLQAKS
jgi:hypothetical protein